MKIKIILTLMTAVLSGAAFAQGNGLSGITDATAMVSSYFEPLTKLIYAVGAVVGLIGGIKVYQSFRREIPTRRRPLPVGSEPVFFWLSLPRSYVHSSCNDGGVQHQ